MSTIDEPSSQENAPHSADHPQVAFGDRDPHFWSIGRIQFHIFMTLHFKKKSLYGTSQNSISERRRFFKKLQIDARKQLANAGYRIPQKALKYFGTAEIASSEKVHSHTLFLITEKHLHLKQQILAAIVKALPRSKIDAPHIEFVEDSKKAAAYICKIPSFAKQTRDLREAHFSTHFIDFAEAYLGLDSRRTNTQVIEKTPLY